nr:zinc finger, CCHC-type, retrotransposon Gag domain protein [Tanacetum cinerariifolium]
SGPSDSGGNPPPVTIHTWLERFNKQKPRSFEKATAPVDAKNWISHMEKIFDVMGCSSGLRHFSRCAMFIYSFYLCYSLSLYPFTERYAQSYFFSCLIRQSKATTMVDAMCIDKDMKVTDIPKLLKILLCTMEAMQQDMVCTHRSNDSPNHNNRAHLILWSFGLFVHGLNVTVKELQRLPPDFVGLAGVNTKENIIVKSLDGNETQMALRFWLVPFYNAGYNWLSNN